MRLIFSGGAVSIFALMSAAAVAAQEQPASGESSDSGALQEITVTATRQSTNLQDTPIAITAVTSEDMTARGLTRVSDLNFVVPNASFQRAQSAFGPGVTTNLRGIASSDTSLAGEATVAYYIDDVYYPILLGSNFDLLDIDHVEVLRGPQGTLFGRNALAGAVNIISKQPDLDEASGYGEVTTGSYHRLDIRAGFNLPIAENAAIMVSGISKTREGYQDRLDFRCEMVRRGTPELAGSFPYTDAIKTEFPANPNYAPDNCVVGHLGGEDVRAVRGAVRWEPAPTISVTLSADYTHDTSENVADTVIDIDPTRVSQSPLRLPNVLAQANYFGIVVDDRFETGNPYQTYTTYQDRIGAGVVLPRIPGDTAPSGYYNGLPTRGGTNFDPNIDLTNWGVSGKIVVNLTDNIDLTAIVGYRSVDSHYTYDTDGIPLLVEHFSSNIYDEYTNAEVRISGKMPWADWVVGAFYFDSYGFNHTINPNAAANTFKVQNTTYEPLSKAVYANGTIRPFGEELSFVLGVRYSDDKKVVHYSNLVDVTPSAADIIFDVTPADTTISWKAGVNYQPTPNMLFYASAATGYQLPGFVGRPLQPSQVQSVDGFRNIAYEIGSKLDLFDRRVRLNLAAFYTDIGTRPTAAAGGQEYRTGGDNNPLPGAQVLEPLPGGPPGSTRCRDRTADEIAAGVPGFLCVGRSFYYNSPATIKGFELEVQANPFEGLNISGNVGYSKFTDAAIEARTVNTRQGDPFWSLGAGIQYRIPADALGGSVTPRLDWSYRSSRITSGTSTALNYLTPPYSVFNGRLTYENDDHDFTLAAGVTNLFNKLYYRNIFDYQTFGYPNTNAQPAPPREWYLTASKKF
jgi:iron complex outermembrane receptor protein